MVTYTFNVTNTGDTALSAVNVTDSVYGVIASGLSLAPGQFEVFMETVGVSSTTTDTATAVGVDMLGTKETGMAMVTVTVLHPGISVTKVPSAKMVVNGTMVTYAFNVTNTGDTGLSAVNITDSVYGVIASGQSLASGQFKVFTKTVAMTATTADTATAVGVDMLGTKVSATAAATVTVVLVPQIKLTKVVSATTVKSGTMVTYTFNVTNVGDTAMSAVNVTDSPYGLIASGLSLTPGQFKVFTKTVAMTATTADTATAVGMDQLGNKVSASASVTVTVTVAPSVGGVSTSIEAFNSQAPWLSIISLLAAAMLLKGIIVKKKRR
jgi:uncharacterized repeat protein (TIGR01451 family)